MATKLVEMLGSRQAVRFSTTVTQFQLKITLERDTEKQRELSGGGGGGSPIGKIKSKRKLLSEAAPYIAVSNSWRMTSDPTEELHSSSEAFALPRWHLAKRFYMDDEDEMHREIV
ncbi:hypothetical protein EV2_018971 [Malus domestica]